MRRILFFLLFPIPLLAQFTYTVDQSIPVEVETKMLANPWAGGLNSAQLSSMDLNADGKDDLVIFDNTSGKINTFLNINNAYQYAPQYEIRFPPNISTFVVLRDFNCDGKKDLFTFGQIGVIVFKNITTGGGPLTFKQLTFYNSTTGFKSDVLLSLGLSGKINLLPGVNDIPNFTDLDGDGDLDVLNMRFVSPSTAEYHKNFSMERYGTCDSLDLERQTQNWGGFEECSCGVVAFGQTCFQLGGGRVEQTQHTGGKVLLTLDVDNDGDKDLFYSEESCTSIYFMQNQGTPTNAVMTSLAPYPPVTPVNILYPAGYYEDCDFDGRPDLIASTNLFVRTQVDNNFQQSIWFYKNTGTTQVPSFNYVKNNFLQEGMIEVGDFSAPAFADIDYDGDQDMFIGQYMGAGKTRASIFYFENRGTRQSPSFRYVTDDFLGLSIVNYYNIKPQFVDLDKNGGIDLVFTATNWINGRTNLYYILSKSNTSASYGGQQLRVASNIVLDISENVSLVDVDLDGTLDALIGRRTGSLEYWRNSGGMIFTMTNNKYLGLDVSPLRLAIAATAGDLDADGHEDLAVGDNNGVISIFSDFRTAGASAQPVSSIIYDSYSESYKSKKLGGKLRPVIVNLMGTDKPEIVTGNTQGGLFVLKNDNGQVLAENPVIVIFPNPLVYGQSLSIKADRSVRMDIFTILGQPIGSSLTIPANQVLTYPLQGIAPGIYVARFTAGSTVTSKRFIIL